ncbi:packaged DNA stabilization protein [Acinetobacter bereziniae]|uniref:packaged DNA stabilization protein n=1 Tax=Acinetobacter bereziniae TaxID=106648 RepID=UPI001115E18E|nr:packaged DNA stabilization protein [Acinetobacter bereziniae]TNL51201.1 hypothetical protein EYB59_08755 [Acinetobacter bereziniae]TNL58445.1 hypothetical protein EYY58_11580 [Acinetobacter bereziniae]
MIKLPLVGPAYKMQAQSMSCQNCINWYPQTIEYPNGSRVAALMPTPGLKKIFQGVTSAVRGLHVLSNGALLVVIGNKLYHSKANKFDLVEVGSISALATVRFADNGRVALIVNGTYTYSLDLKKLTLTRLSGSAIPRSTHVVFLDGRFVFNKANTGQFHWSDLYSTNVNALSYATAESTPDNVTAIIEFNSTELWLFGSQSVERYYGTGSSNAPFSRLSGGAMSFGCLAPDSIVSLSTGVIWLGVSEFGGSQIVMSAGGIPERISTHALEEEIASFSKISDAMAYAYQMEGHVFYVISFPSANVTFCFDVSTGLWHQRSFANAQGLHERHRSQHHAYFNNIHIVGDYRNGKLYQLDNNVFTDDGELILRERTAQAVITDQKLTRFNQLQIICETGFYGEIKKEDPKPPVISCVGATNTVLMHRAVLINPDESTIFPEWEKFIINGIESEDPPEYIQSEPSLSPPFPPPNGYKWADSILIKNNANFDVRFEHQMIPANQNLARIVLSDNPTVISFDANRNGVCLSGKSSTVISCEGATYRILFEPAPLFNGIIDWTIEFDGVSYPLGRVNGNEILTSLPSVIKDKIFTDWDGFWVLENRDTLPHRFKLTPSAKPEIDPIQATWTEQNQSFLLNEDGSFVFCLSSKVITISCDGASDQQTFSSFGGFWDMELNGIFYQSSSDALPYYISKHFSESLSAFDDGNMVIMNTSNIHQRIRLIPVLNATFLEPSGNNTFLEHEDGSLTFCLKSSCIPTQIAIEDKGMDLPPNSFVSLTYSLSIPSENIEIENRTILVNAQENGTAPVFQEAIRQILDIKVQIVEGSGGNGHFQHYRTWIHGGDGSGFGSNAGEVTITLHNTNTSNPRVDLMNFLQMYGETQYFSDIAPVVIHSCGEQYFPGL